MSKEKSIYYTYILTNPLKLYINKNFPDLIFEPFYVGFSGRESRIKEHLSCLKSDKNNHKKNTIKKILKNNLKVDLVKVLKNVTKQQAIDEEIQLITTIGRADKGLGSLTNMTDGGEGVRGNMIDLTGKIFNRLSVKKYVESDKRDRSRWLCKCDCGKENIIRGDSLIGNKIKSCGCLQKENIIELNKIHDRSSSIEYKIWQQTLQKCNNPKNSQFVNFKRLEITVCDRWLKFQNFYDDMGDRPSKKHVLSRINTSKGYFPDNCKWTTRTERNRTNKRNIFLTINEERKTISEWSEKLNIKSNKIRKRISRGWTPKEAVFGKSNS